MKTNIFSISVFLLVLISCTTEIKKEKKQVPAKSQVKESVHKPEIFSGVETMQLGIQGEKDESRISYAYYKIGKESYRYKEEINKFLATVISTEMEEQSKPNSAVELSPKYFKTILKQFKNQFDKYGEDSPWSYFDSTFIDESFEQFVQVKRNSYSFTGGAHGNSIVSSNIFSRETGEQINLKDFISDVPKLTKIGDNYFRQIFEIKATDDLEQQGFWFTKGFELNGNFYFEDNKMIFVYNQYEIGPYSLGIISVEIPIREIKSLLKISIEKQNK